MRRLVIAALGILVALAALAQCGGTSGNDATPSPALGATIDATVDAAVEGAATAEAQDASSDQSIYTNRFDVDIQYADQMLPEAQAPPEGGGSGSGGEAGLGIPDCPPFIYVDSTGRPLEAGTCDPGQGCADTNAWGSIPADWNNGGEIPARDGGACASYPWLGSLASDECLTSNTFGGLTSNASTYNVLPPCEWARDAGVATQGPKVGAPRYNLCVELYNCFMRTGCFITPNPHPAVRGFYGNPILCLCLKPSDLLGTFNPSTCVSEKGPCYDEETAALEAPIDPNNPASTAAYAQMNWVSTQVGNGEVGLEGALLNQMFGYALTTGCFPPCALDAGLGCDQ
jgi:hypothetical protein